MKQKAGKDQLFSSSLIFFPFPDRRPPPCAELHSLCDQKSGMGLLSVIRKVKQKEKELRVLFL